MSEKEMPAAEAGVVEAGDAASYELAFHVLPTVAEGEVATVFQHLKGIITKAGGEITTEEAPARFDLAYEVVKYLEGRNRKFSSAYFGWVRFSVDSAAVETITEGVEGTKELLRHMIIKLTKAEEENPFFFHEALAAQKTNVTIDVDEADDSKDESEDEESDESEADSSEDGEESKDEV